MLLLTGNHNADRFKYLYQVFLIFHLVSLIVLMDEGQSMSAVVVRLRCEMGARLYVDPS